MSLHCKKSFSIFPSPAGMSLTKLSLGGNNLYMTSLFPPRKSLVIDVPAGDGNIKKLFLQCRRFFRDPNKYEEEGTFNAQDISMESLAKRRRIDRHKYLVEQEKIKFAYRLAASQG